MQSQRLNAPADLSDPLSVFAVIDVLWARRWSIVLTCIACTALAGTYAFIATPYYRAEVLVQPVTDRSSASLIGDLIGDVGGLAPLVGAGGLLGEAEPNIAVPLLTANQFLSAFILEHELLPRLFESQWDAGRKQWRDPDNAPTLAKGIKALQRNVIGVREDRRRGLVTITVTWRDRMEATEWADLLVKRVNAQTRAMAIGDAQRSRTYLDRELSKTTILDVQRAIHRLIETQIKTEMVANVRDDFSLHVIDAARVPDADEFIRPRRQLLIAGGFVFGMALGMFIALVRRALANRAHEARETPAATVGPR